MLAVTPVPLTPELALLTRSRTSCRLSVAFTLMAAEPPLPVTSKLPESASALVLSANVEEATLCAVATRRTSRVWLPAVAALVVLAPTRLPAALGRLPSVRLVVAKTCLAEKTSPVFPRVTEPRKVESDWRRLVRSDCRSPRAAILSTFSAMRFSIESMGMRLAAMISATIPWASIPELRPEKMTRPFESTDRLLRLRVSIRPSRQPKIQAVRASSYKVPSVPPTGSLGSSRRSACSRSVRPRG